MSDTKFCAYCRLTKLNVGFKAIVHPGTGSRRYQCPTCQEVRKKPRTELEKLAETDAKARGKAQSELLKKIREERRKSEP